VCLDQMIEPDLLPSRAQICHIRDAAPTDWSDQDRKKYHQTELQALLAGPIPAEMQLVIRDLGFRASDGWLRAVPRLGDLKSKLCFWPVTRKLSR
jgi:hypothetical protein